MSSGRLKNGFKVLGISEGLNVQSGVQERFMGVCAQGIAARNVGTRTITLGNLGPEHTTLRNDNNNCKTTNRERKKKNKEKKQKQQCKNKGEKSKKERKKERMKEEEEEERR